jgi:[ribosomal protein S18]-alanine N-acetyltransferase
VNVRRATEADVPAMEELVAAYLDELWARPFPPPALPDSFLREGRLLVAELDGEIVGMAKGELRPGLGHVTLVYLRPEARGQGGGKELVRGLASFFHDEGVKHVSLNVDVSNEEALAYWRRLGFVDYRRSLLTDLGALEQRLAGGDAPSAGSVHVQTDDQSAVERAVARFAARIVRSPATVVSAPDNGWIGVYDEAAAREPERLRKLASELSNITGGVVIALGAEHGAVVRLVAFDRGQLMDEYLSVPEYYGALPPGDVVALRANPTLLGRLTGAEPAGIRAVARTANSPAELPSANELLVGLANALGIEGAGLGFAEAASLEGAVTVTHDS